MSISPPFQAAQPESPNSLFLVAGIFLLLGLACMLWPREMAELGIRLQSANTRRESRLMKRYPHVTQWSGRIIGGVLFVTGLVLCFVGFSL